MFCSKCGNQNDEILNFCRRCGAPSVNTSVAPSKQNLLQKRDDNESLMPSHLIDPDELTGKGIGNVIIGDGFFLVALLLSATHSSVSSLLWLFLLIPAFFFFGNGFADIFRARQIRQRGKRVERLINEPQTKDLLPPPRESIFETIKKHASGELLPVPSVTEKTTRGLK